MIKNSQISLLDVLLHREDGGSIQPLCTRNQHILADLYTTTPTIPGKLEVVVRSLFERLETHGSNTSLMMEEECKIMEELQANWYPKNFVENARKQMLLPKNKDRNYMEVVLEDGQVLC